MIDEENIGQDHNVEHSVVNNKDWRIVFGKKLTDLGS